MAKEINPRDTTRASAFALWMKAPNPMVTFFKTLDVTNRIRISRRKKLKFNLDYLKYTALLPKPAAMWICPPTAW